MRELISLARNAIQNRVFPGCVIGVISGDEITVLPFGRYTYAPDSPVVSESSLYDCASLTKSVVTATLALQLLAENRLTLSSKLIEFVPEYSTKNREGVTVLHLLTYTLGNTLPLSRAGNTPEEIFSAVCVEDTRPPGTVFSYSNTPAYFLGIVLERITGSPLDLLARERIFWPFRMDSTTFRPRGAAPTQAGIQDMVHDESARIFARAGKTVGHAGLFSTVPDTLSFLNALLRCNDQRFCTNQIPHLGVAGLGWELDQEWMGKRRSKRTFGKTGFTGCSIAANFETAQALVIFSNHTYPTRPASSSAINALRREMCDIVFRS